MQGVRGRAGVDIGALEELLVRFSHLVVEQHWIKEIDINPLLASGDGLMALDARVVLYDSETTEDRLPRFAVRPYPIQYSASWRMKNGKEITIRPIRPEDEPLMVGFHQKLSERTVYLRYFQPLKLSQRTAHERLRRICFSDYDREMVLVGEYNGDLGAEIIAVGRLSKLHARDEGELAVLVDDRFQHMGIGTELYQRLIHIAHEEKLTRVQCTVLTENHEMQAICQKLGFRLSADPEDGTVRAELNLFE